MNKFITGLCIIASLIIVACAGQCKETRVPIHRYSSIETQHKTQNFYTSSIEAVPCTMCHWKEYYVDEGAAFHLEDPEPYACAPDLIPLYRFQIGTAQNQVGSFLTTTPESATANYFRFVESLGQCYTEQNGNDELVALHRFYKKDGNFDEIYKTDKEAIEGYEYGDIVCYVFSEPRSSLDMIIILDSSGSVADKDYLNWQSEIDFAAAAVDAIPDDGSLAFDGFRVALINFSGCGPKVSFEECDNLKKEWGLTDYSSKEEVLARIESMGPDDFNYGWSWTDEALQVALSEFEENSSPDRRKIIVMLTAGAPQPANQGHEPCKASTSYVSETVGSLREMKVNMFAIGVWMTEESADEYFGCMSLGGQFTVTVDDFHDLDKSIEEKGFDWPQ